MTNWSTASPFEISNYDNPETIRFRKYATGTNLIVNGTKVEAGLTPTKAVWQKDEARPYPVPVLIVYAPILRP